MEQQYDKKWALLVDGRDQTDFQCRELLESFWKRICCSPFKAAAPPAQIWLTLWNDLGEERERLVDLPDPCLNHLEERMRKPARAKKLVRGSQRLVGHDRALFVEALRLYPHAVCRASEVVGAVSDETWKRVEALLLSHRLWSVERELTATQFWAAVDRLGPYRELPQVVLDFLDTDRAREAAPLEEFIGCLERFLTREKIEKIRFQTYAVLTGKHDRQALKPVSQ